MAIEKAYLLVGMDGKPPVFRFDITKVLVQETEGLMQEFHNPKTGEIVIVFGSRPEDFKGLTFQKAAELLSAKGGDRHVELHEIAPATRTDDWPRYGTITSDPGPPMH